MEWKLHDDGTVYIKSARGPYTGQVKSIIHWKPDSDKAFAKTEGVCKYYHNRTLAMEFVNREYRSKFYSSNESRKKAIRYWRKNGIERGLVLLYSADNDLYNLDIGYSVGHGEVSALVIDNSDEFEIVLCEDGGYKWAKK